MFSRFICISVNKIKEEIISSHESFGLRMIILLIISVYRINFNNIQQPDLFFVHVTGQKTTKIAHFFLLLTTIYNKYINTTVSILQYI